MEKVEKISKPSKAEKAEKEKIAKQHTIQSAISNEFQDFAFEEKVALVSAIYVAFVEAFNTGKPICAANDYSITPEIYNEFLAHSYTSNDECTSSPLKALTYKMIAVGVDKIFEREINYHVYIRKSLVIYKARIIPSFKLTLKNEHKSEIIAIHVNICIAIVHELNKILVKSKGSLSTALKLINQLLNNVKPPLKDIS